MILSCQARCLVVILCCRRPTLRDNVHPLGIDLITQKYTVRRGYRTRDQ